MAFDAFDGLVCAEQPVVRVPVMIEHGFRPVIVVVAGIAVVTIVLVVFVVFEMAGDACLVLFILERIFGVAVIASCLGVLALERKFGVPGVIEAGVVPVSGIVALLAFLAASTLVRVVLGVTAIAGRRRVLVGRVFMAIETRSLFVLAEQGIVGRLMIEACFFPLGGLVTLATVRAERLLVGIVLAVTVVAKLGRLPIQGVRLMTVLAFGVGVRIDQFEVREIVVERRLIQADDVRVTADMVGVARGALHVFYVGGQTVKTLLCPDISADIFVAVHAQLALSGFIEPLVARRTLALEVRMTGNHFAGHDSHFKVLSRHGATVYKG